MHICQKKIYSIESVEKFKRVHHHLAFYNILASGLIKFLYIKMSLHIALISPP